VCGTFVCNAIFPSPSFFHSLFLSCFKDELKAIVLAWCPDNDNVTHKYLVEMRRLARDETPFLSVVQLRATTLAWWPDDGNVIPLDTHDHDRSARDETSYPPTNPLSILSFILVGPPFLTDKCFIAFLGDPWVKHLEGLYIGFYLLPNNNPSGPSTPSSHRMRDNPFLGQYTLKSQEIRKWGV
jgi:hypothetical protein